MRRLVCRDRSGLLISILNSLIASANAVKRIIKTRMPIWPT